MSCSRTNQLGTAAKLQDETKINQKCPPASKWGNPYCIDTKNGLDRTKVIHLFEKYLMNNAELRDSVNELFGKKLGCWCAPQQCHGEFLHRSAGNHPVYQTI